MMQDDPYARVNDREVMMNVSGGWVDRWVGG